MDAYRRAPFAQRHEERKRCGWDAVGDMTTKKTDDDVVVLPPGTKRRGTLRPAVGLSASELRKRAIQTHLHARGGIAISTKINPTLYEAILELAEAYHEEFYAVLRQCLADGVRKYRDLSLPDSPFARPLRTDPGLRVLDHEAVERANGRTAVLRGANADLVAEALEALQHGSRETQTVFAQPARIVPPRVSIGRSKYAHEQMMPQTAIKESVVRSTSPDGETEEIIEGEIAEEQAPTVLTDDEIDERNAGAEQQETM